MGESLPQGENLYELATFVTRDLIKHSNLYTHLPTHTFSLAFFPDFAAIMCWIIALIMFLLKYQFPTLPKEKWRIKFLFQGKIFEKQIFSNLIMSYHIQSNDLNHSKKDQWTNLRGDKDPLDVCEVQPFEIFSVVELERVAILIVPGPGGHKKCG